MSSSCIKESSLLNEHKALREYCDRLRQKYARDTTLYLNLIEELKAENASLREKAVLSGNPCCAPKCNPCPVHDVPFVDSEEDLLEDIELEMVAEEQPKKKKTRKEPAVVAINWASASFEELLTCKVAHLKQMCKDNGLTGYSKISKKEMLVKYILEHRHTVVVKPKVTMGTPVVVAHHIESPLVEKIEILTETIES